MATPPGTAAPSSAAAAASTAPLPMSAPSIPNLLARLGNGPPRAGRGGRRGLGRGGSRGSLHTGPGSGMHQPPYPQPRHQHHQGGHGGGKSTLDHNGIIQSTDTDAALSRLSAVDIGLLEDPFAQYFAGDGGPAPRRLPIINRGTYTRTHALDTVIRAFLSGTSSTNRASEPPPPRQVVSLGAGTDTRGLRLLSRQSDGSAAFQNVIYHEIDFPAVCARKRNIVQSVPSIRSLLASAVTEHTPLNEGAETASSSSNTTTYQSWHAELGHGNQLWGHGLDLRQLAVAVAAPTSTGAGGETILAGLRTDVPTLLVSECCLCYLQPPEAAAVLRWFADRIASPASSPAAASSLGIVLYEPILPNDAFGRTMVANLAARGIEMPTLVAYPDSAAQEARLRHEVGLVQAGHRTIDAIWDAWVAEDEQERVNGLDGLDEVEEWTLLASHYIVAWGSRGPYFDAAWARLYQA